MNRNIYNDNSFTEDSNVELDTILYVDADSTSTLMTDVKLIRDRVSVTATGETIVVFVISSGVTTKTVYWDSLFSYMAQISVQSEITFNVLFRGCITLDMLTVFKYPPLQVSISDSIDIVYTPHSILRYIGWNPDKLKIIMNGFSPVFNSLDSISSFILKGSIAVLDELSYNFDSF